MSENPTPAYVHATPNRVMSTLAYVLLSQDTWPVYVSTARNYSYRSGYDTPTDPGETIHGSGHFRPVADYNPFAPFNTYAREDGWADISLYLDDRIRPQSESRYSNDAFGDAWDEYFILVSGPSGQNLVEYSDYSGSTFTASNYRCLLRDYPGVFVEVSYGHGGHGLAIPLFVPVAERDEHEASGICQTCPHYDRDSAEELAGRLNELLDYPVYDEDDMSAYEQELVEEVTADQWWQNNTCEGVAKEMAEILIARVVPTDFQLSGIPEDADHNPDLFERARAWGVDTYELTERLEQWLEDQTELRDEWQSAGETGYHTVYSLFVQHIESEYGVQYEGATSSGVVFRGSEDGYAWLADHIINGHGSIYRTPVEIPLLTDGNE